MIYDDSIFQTCLLRVCLCPFVSYNIMQYCIYIYIIVFLSNIYIYIDNIIQSLSIYTCIDCIIIDPNFDNSRKHGIWGTLLESNHLWNDDHISTLR